MSRQTCQVCERPFIKCACHTDPKDTVHGVYGEWCRDPTLCVDLGYCPRDPTCAD